MNLLAIETSTESCSVALSVQGEQRGRYAREPRGHAELLLPWVSELLADANIGLSQLDAIVFSRGPGSFTSLRIGIGVTQGLAWGADIPVVPVSSLHTTAQVAAGQGVTAALVALDARMNEVYCGAFVQSDAGLMQPVGNEAVCPPEHVLERESKGWSGVGNGFARYSVLAAFGTSLDGVYADTWPQAQAMIPLAIDWLNSNRPLPAEQAQAVYIRDQVAEKPAA